MLLFVRQSWWAVHLQRVVEIIEDAGTATRKPAMALIGVVTDMKTKCDPRTASGVESSIRADFAAQQCPRKLSM